MGMQISVSHSARISHYLCANGSATHRILGPNGRHKSQLPHSGVKYPNEKFSKNMVILIVG